MTDVLMSSDGGVTFSRLSWQSSWFSTGQLTLPNNLFSAGQYVVKVQSYNYHDAFITQTIINPTAEVGVKSTDSSKVIVELGRELLFIEDKDLTVGDIKLLLGAVNGATQSYRFIYSDGDDKVEYLDTDKIRPYHSSVMYVTSEDGTTVSPYTILAVVN